TSGDAGAELRWKLALCGADRLLAGLGFNTKDKRTLAERMRAFREQPWIVDELYKQQLARKFRPTHLRQNLTALVDRLDDEGNKDDTGTLPPDALHALHRFSRSLQVVRGQWEELQRAGHLAKTIPEL